MAKPKPGRRPTSSALCTRGWEQLSSPHNLPSTLGNLPVNQEEEEEQRNCSSALPHVLWADNRQRYLSISLSLNSLWIFFFLLLCLRL